MTTRVGSEDDPIRMLEHLIALDFDAIEAYEAAIDRLDNVQYQARLAAFLADHRRHVEELSPLVRRLGGEPPGGPGAKRLLAQGKVYLADLAGDEAILRAMRSNEDDTNEAYGRAVGKAPKEAEAIVLRGREDERRHREWLVATLDELAGRPRPTSRTTIRPGAYPPMPPD